jgi:hypothetical protein
VAIQQSPRNVYDIFSEFERRIRALETSPRIGFTSIQDGSALVVLDAAKKPVVRIGTLKTGGYGIEYWNGTAWTVVASHATGDPAGL